MSEKMTSKEKMIGGGALLAAILAIWLIISFVRSQGIQAGPPPAVVGKGQKIMEMEAEKAAQQGGAAPTTAPRIDPDATTVDANGARAAASAGGGGKR